MALIGPNSSTRIGNPMSSQFNSYTTVIAAVLLVLLQAYKIDAMPSSRVAVQDEFGDRYQDLDQTDAPYVNKRFFSSPGLQYPVLYRSGRFPIRVNKKALSLFTRWRGGSPYTGGAGFQDAGANDSQGVRDIVSAVSRATGNGRPLGQPLRWGK